MEIDMSWIKTIRPEEATGALKVEYERAIQRAGKVFNILKIQSLNPRSLRASMHLYLATMYGRSGLPAPNAKCWQRSSPRRTDAFIEFKRTGRISVGKQETRNWLSTSSTIIDGPGFRPGKRLFAGSR